MEQYKVCNECNTRKRINEFYKNTTYKSGVEKDCKKCRLLKFKQKRAERRMSMLKEEISYKTKEHELRNQSMAGEIWKDIPFASNYQASNLGRIRSKNMETKDGKLLYGSIKKPSVHTSGYLRYTLTIDGEHKSHYGHNLVASAFMECAKPTGYDIDHIDKCRINNNISNLRYISIKENRGRLFNRNAIKNECK